MDGNLVVRDGFADRVFVDLKVAEVLCSLVLGPENTRHVVVE